MTALEYLALFVAVAPLAGNMLALLLRSRGYHVAADWVVRMTPLAVVAASSKSREEAILRVVDAVSKMPIEAQTIVAKVAAADVKSESMPPPSSAAKVLPLSVLMLCLALVGCASPIHFAAAVNNVTTDTLNETAPKLRKHCVEGMGAVESREQASALNDVCEPATLAYGATSTGVGVLRAAILAAAAGDASKLDAAIADVIALAKDLATKMGALK